MVEQGSEVDPATARLENLVNHLNKVDDVMCTVDEKTRDNNLSRNNESTLYKSISSADGTISKQNV